MLTKKERITWLFTLGIFAAQFVDIFFIHTNHSVFGDSIVARVVGIILVIVAVKLLDFDLKKFCFRAKYAFNDILLGVFFSAVPIIGCFLLEYFYFKYSSIADLSISFTSPNYLYFGDNNFKYLAALIYFLVVLVGTIFKEMYFRGFMITQLSPRLGVFKANLIQAIVYALFSLPYIAFCIFSGVFDSMSTELKVLIILAYPVNNFISGLKLGYFFRVNGSLWMGITDHLINNFILTCMYITPDRLPDKWYVIEVILIQIVSCIMFIPFYFYKDKRNVMIAQNVNAGRNILASGGDLYTPEEEKKLFHTVNYSENKNPNQNAGEYFETIKNRYLVTDVVDLRKTDNLEEAVSSVSIDEKPGAERLLKDFPSFGIKDEVTDNLYEAVSLEEGLNNIQKESNTEKSDSNGDQADNSDSISDVVSKYFDEQFNKRTFN